MRIWGRYPLRNAGQLTVLTPMLDFGLGRRGRFEWHPVASRSSSSQVRSFGSRKPHDDGWGHALLIASFRFAESVPTKLDSRCAVYRKVGSSSYSQRKVLYYRQVRVNPAYLRGTSRERLALTMGHCASRRVMDTKVFQA